MSLQGKTPDRAVSYLRLGCLVLAAVACYLPWLWHPAAALSPGVLDLAEWASLAPGMRGGPVAMLPSLLLRACMGLLAWATWAGADSRQSRRAVTWLQRALAVVLVLVLLPPADFLLTTCSDLNYCQQFGIAVVTAGSMFAASVLRLRLEKWVAGLAVGALLASAVCGVAGLMLSTQLSGAMGVRLAIGAGGPVYLLAVMGESARILLATRVSANPPEI